MGRSCKTVLLIFLGVIVVASSSVVEQRSPEQTISMDLNEDFNVTWYTINQKDIVFKVTVRTTGWIGLGFSPAGGMKGADIIICGVGATGNGYLEDRFAPEIGYPRLDDSQDVEMIMASEQDGVTTVAFKRSLTNCDDKDLDITTSTVRMIFAWGPTDSLSKHSDSQRGQKSIYLLDKPKPEPESYESEDILTHDFVYESGYTVPEGLDTVYTYGLVKGPELNGTKHHVLSFDAIITPGYEGIVHHMMIYACYLDLNGTAHLEQRNIYEASELMPPEMAECRHAFFTWAIGGGKFDYPEHVGVPIGETDSPKWWLLNTHYNNPTKQRGRIPDFSGVRIQYSRKTRTHDMGVTMIAANIGFYIPPGQKEFYIRGDCSAECLSQALPPEGVNMFGYLLHTHLLGSGISLLKRSGGGDPVVIAEDKTYDFNYQETRHLPAEIKINQNDELTLMCKMNSQGRKDVTFSGEATSDEMCVALMFYYPKCSLSFCASSHPWVAQPFGLNVAPGEIWADNAMQTDWTAKLVLEAQKKDLVSNYNPFCTTLDGRPVYNNMIYEGNSAKFNESMTRTRTPITTRSCEPSCKHPGRDCTPYVWSSYASTPSFATTYHTSPPPFIVAAILSAFYI